MRVPLIFRCLLVVCLLVCCFAEADADGVRGALIVTIAGNHKLSDYFEWSCKTIGASKDRFDMLVFHETNSKLTSLKCASNVKLIDLGENGLSKAIISKILDGATSNEAVKGRMTMMLNDILTHGPRYLVEIKPMLGDLFREHLTSYSHWSYTDPDIVWGNLSDWVEEKDLKRFEIVTIAKNNDAGRLFLRGQVRVFEVAFIHPLLTLIMDLSVPTHSSRTTKTTARSTTCGKSSAIYQPRAFPSGSAMRSGCCKRRNPPMKSSVGISFLRRVGILNSPSRRMSARRSSAGDLMTSTAIRWCCTRAGSADAD